MIRVVAVTLGSRFHPLYAALYCDAGGDGDHGVATYFGLVLTFPTILPYADELMTLTITASLTV